MQSRIAPRSAVLALLLSLTAPSVWAAPAESSDEGAGESPSGAGSQAPSRKTEASPAEGASEPSAGQPEEAEIEKPAAPAVPVLLLPFAPLHGEAPQSLGDRAAQLLKDKLSDEESASVRFVGAEAAAGEGASDDRKAIAQAAVRFAKGSDLVKKRKYNPAAKEYTEGIALFLSHFAGADDFTPLIDAHIALATLQFRLEEEDQAHALLDAVVRLDPSRVVSENDTVRELARYHADVRRAAFAANRGRLIVRSQPAGARVAVDGRDVGETPVVVTGVLSGEHFVRLVKPAGGAATATVKVEGGKTEEISPTLSASGMGEEAILTRGLMANRLDAEVLEAARAAGRKAGAQFVVFGALRITDDEILAIRPYALQVSDGQLVELPEMQTDTEMVSAGIAAFNVVKELQTQIGQFDGRRLDDGREIFAGAKPSARANRPTEFVFTPDSIDTPRADDARSRKRLSAQKAKAEASKQAAGKTSVAAAPATPEPPRVKERCKADDAECWARQRRPKPVVEVVAEDEGETKPLPGSVLDAATSPEQLAALRKADQAKIAQAPSSKAWMWWTGGAVVATTAAVVTYMLIPTTPTSTTVHVSWNP